MPSEHYPSLFIVLNGDKALFYQINEASIDSLDSMNEPMDTFSDKEGFFASSAPGHAMGGGAPDDSNEQDHEHTKKHIRHSVERLKDICSSHTFQHITFTVPTQLKQTVQHELSNTFSDREIHIIDGNYGHAHQDQIRELFLKSIRPQ